MIFLLDFPLINYRCRNRHRGMTPSDATPTPARFVGMADIKGLITDHPCSLDTDYDNDNDNDNDRQLASNDVYFDGEMRNAPP